MKNLLAIHKNPEAPPPPVFGARAVPEDGQQAFKFDSKHYSLFSVFTGFILAAFMDCPRYGLYAAISYDEGKTWPLQKLITPADAKRHFARHGADGPTAPFVATSDNAEYQGYLAADQASNGIIHLISSRLHYQFNLAWLKKPFVHK